MSTPYDLTPYLREFEEGKSEIMKVQVTLATITSVYSAHFAKNYLVVDPDVHKAEHIYPFINVWVGGSNGRVAASLYIIYLVEEDKFILTELNELVHPTLHRLLLGDEWYIGFTTGDRDTIKQGYFKTMKWLAEQ
jgi:hypothetical protein